MALAREIYDLTREFPSDERFGLTAQMRRCAVSVPSNIAEGAARGSVKDLIRFLTIARASLMELDTQLRLARDFGYFSDTDHLWESVDRVFALLNGLIRSKRSSQA